MCWIKIKSEYKDLDKYDNNGSIYYFKKETGAWHNPYGPAIIYKHGYKQYIIENKLHRLDGPAIILLHGRGEYYINDKKLSKEEFELHPERLKFIGKEYLTCLK